MHLDYTTTGIQQIQGIGKLSTWITYNTPNVLLGILPANYFVDRANIHVHTAFNAGTTNNISIGYSGSEQYFVTNTSVSSTGRKSPSLGTGTGINTTGQKIYVYYSQSGSAATTGKAYVELFIYRIPPTP